MKKILSLFVVLLLTTPVSACYFACKDVNADDFVNELVDYCNDYKIHNMSCYDLDISNHGCKIFDVNQTNNTLDFKIEAHDRYAVIIPPYIPYPWCYFFVGSMHVDNPKDGLKKPYTLTITDERKKFTAVGKNWRLEVENTESTRFLYK